MIGDNGNNGDDGAIPLLPHSIFSPNLVLTPHPISTASSLAIRCFPNSTHAVYNGILAVLSLLLITLNYYNYVYNSFR